MLKVVRVISDDQALRTQLPPARLKSIAIKRWNASFAAFSATTFQTVLECITNDVYPPQEGEEIALEQRIEKEGARGYLAGLPGK